MWEEPTAKVEEAKMEGQPMVWFSQEESAVDAESTTLSVWISLPLDGTHWEFGPVKP